MQTPEWQIIEGMKKEFCRQLQSNSKTKDTIDETVIATVREEGMVAGVNKFFQELLNEVMKDNTK